MQSPGKCAVALSGESMLHSSKLACRHQQLVAVLVCGADGFLETICGDKQMITIPGTTYQKKVRGPITGLLGQLGFDDDDGALVVKM
mmetsp:Transcript_17093/g.25821  ORF Transcript_17093/g.25821 Transcript_17093/m.25821 type:complete len:87 (+) Transcript_17093:66-326(+)